MITTQGGSLKALCACGATGPPDGEGPEGNEVGPASAQWNRRAHLATETAAIAKVRDEMLAEVHSDEAECITNEYLCGCHRLRPYIAALDEFLEGRKK